MHATMHFIIQVTTNISILVLFITSGCQRISVYTLYFCSVSSRPLLWMAIYCVMTYFHINGSTKSCCRMFSNIKVWFNDDINKFYLLRCRDAMAGVAYSCIIQIRMPMKLEHHYSISSCVARNDVSFYATSFLLFILDVGLMQWYEFTKPNISTNLSAASSPGVLEKSQRYFKGIWFNDIFIDNKHLRCMF